MLGKKDELEDWVVSHNPHIFAVTKTWPTPNARDSEISPHGYTVFRTDRSLSRRGGGVIHFVRSSLPVRVMENYAHSEGFEEALWCRIKLCAGKYITVGVIYGTPAVRVPELLDSIQRYA
ncbi:unnamed protein product [Echinostoma caproni]|uniref:START domain-containing protein n=1 Tax=Echinostoma caproni TaxID=27848 RepID=A0A183ACZ8_9TREM|nr:unnamed protein product [Echinostoma caproni]